MSEYEKLREFVDRVLKSKEPLFGNVLEEGIPKKLRRFNP